MADETTQLILGDAAAVALGQPRKRRFFGRKTKQRERLTNCENCGVELAGEYCAKCGQHAIDYRRSLIRVLIDAADSFLNWDTKFLKSVGVLLVTPWRLTNDFNAGKRVRYVHPLRLYLLASIAFFLLARLVNLNGMKADKPMQLTPEDRAEIDSAVAKLSAPDSPLSPEQRAKIDAARARWMAPDPAEPPHKRAAFEKMITRLNRIADKETLKPKDINKIDVNLKVLDELDAQLGVKPPPAPPPPVDAVPESPNASAPTAAAPSPAPGAGPRIHFGTGTGEKKTPFESWLETRIKDKVGEDGTKATLFLETLRSNVPTMMLACVPLFAFVLKVLYVRQRRYYVEHLVYALHIHTFVYVAVVVITLLAMALQRIAPGLETVIVTLLSFVVFAQVFLSIRRVYRQGWFMSTFKFMLGGVAYLTVLATALTLTAFITLLLP
jgi:hypothetical protein